MPEAACTSTQFHVQTSPDQFADYWNASQAIAAAQLAVGANSPYLLGKQLWRETRIPLFEQATDTRSEELKAQGVRPRVWFGERWITSVFDLFEENVRYFPALLPVTDDEDPLEVLEAGGTPQLAELRLHNGTIYRWNRPVYDIADGVPHLRVENRLLAAGPTVADTMANAAFYFGLVRAARRGASGRCGRRCRSAPRRRTSTSPPSRASTRRSTGPASARSAPPSWCCAGCCRWPTGASRRGGSRRPSATGCSASSSSAACTGTTGAEWFVRRMRRHADLDRYDALRATLLDYARGHAHQRAGAHLGVSGARLSAGAAASTCGRARCAGRASRGG